MKSLRYYYLLFQKALFLVSLKLHENRWHKRLKYLFYCKKSNTLIIIFNGFNSVGDIRNYNYVRGLQNLPFDRLYILDVWGYRGSYYLYENGHDYPRLEVENLIIHIKRKGDYSRIITLGSSKGGTCALYFGLQFHAQTIFAGACQYNLGNYLSRFRKIFHGMMGPDASQPEIDLLNSIMPTQLEKCKNDHPEIHLVYSKNEPTYEEDIVDLLEKLHTCNFSVIEKVEQFDDHNQIGYYFLNYVQKKLFVDKV